jgi:hypothetical protein
MFDRLHGRASTYLTFDMGNEKWITGVEKENECPQISHDRAQGAWKEEKSVSGERKWQR